MVLFHPLNKPTKDTHMTPEQALQMLDGAVLTMNLERAQHANLQQAVATLAQKIAPPAMPTNTEVVDLAAATPTA